MPDAWHWNESDITPWCKAQLETLLQNRRLFDKEGVACRTGKVYTVKGEASVSTRRGKQMLVVEFQVQVSWHAILKQPKGEDGVEKDPVQINGLLTLPNITEDTIDKTEVEIALEPTQQETPQATQVLATVRKFSKEAAHNVVLQFWADLREKYGKATVENKVVDEASERQKLGKGLVQWMQMHMFNEVRREWTSRKAIALRTIITGIMTASGSIMVGGPAGLIAATAIMGGGFGGYKGYRRQLDSFGDFAEAFMGSDFILLVEMATRFVLNGESAGLRQDNIEEWLDNKKNLRNFILWYCKELSEDDPAEAGQVEGEATATLPASPVQPAASAEQATAGAATGNDTDPAQPSKRRYHCCNPASFLRRGAAAAGQEAAQTAAGSTVTHGATTPNRGATTNAAPSAQKPATTVHQEAESGAPVNTKKPAEGPAKAAQPVQQQEKPVAVAKESTSTTTAKTASPSKEPVSF
eukprot:TRINITY_DN594_c0_g1_i1.p1 TRINITY_DN594_c0_g1~~TRINITY_DN594_c0_g1_i1.p1  ORF type:complete len:469 (-),score=93.29 TRINITY_DN594_c0_g1_i1:85-1491(-)